VRRRRLGPWKLVAAQMQWFLEEVVPAALTELGLSSLYGAESVSAVVRWAPAALRQFRRRAPGWTIDLSPAGDALAIVQNLQVSFRYATDNFRITKTTWKSTLACKPECPLLGQAAVLTFNSAQHASRSGDAMALLCVDRGLQVLCCRHRHGPRL
jgi:hypothetical protein